MRLYATARNLCWAAVLPLQRRGGGVGADGRGAPTVVSASRRCLQRPPFDEPARLGSPGFHPPARSPPRSGPGPAWSMDGRADACRCSSATPRPSARMRTPPRSAAAARRSRLVGGRRPPGRLLTLPYTEGGPAGLFASGDAGRPCVCLLACWFVCFGLSPFGDGLNGLTAAVSTAVSAQRRRGGFLR